MIQVFPVIEPVVRELCTAPYAGHPHGCPNFGNRETCPPQALLFFSVYDLAQPVYAVINEFDLGRHVVNMRAAHPKWSDRQLRCVLYWQGTARAALKQKVIEALRTLPVGFKAEMCPEAMGVNITETLRRAKIHLEWPPVHIARQVALLAKPIKRGSHE